MALAQPVCKYARVMDVPERIPQFVHEAFAAAIGGRPGPVHLTFPADVQEAAVDPSKLVGRTGTSSVPGRKVADEGAIVRAADLLGGARRPLLIAGSGVHALNILEALRATVTEETILVVDGGNIGQWFHQILCDRYPNRYLTCGASAVVGFGIAGAMAARVGFPDRPVILLSGDVSLTFTIAEIECAARQGLPFVVIVADDEAWGITATAHVKQFGRAIASTLGPIQFDLLARGFGVRGARVSRVDEIAPAIREALLEDRPTVLHVPIVGGMPGD